MAVSQRRGLSPCPSGGDDREFVKGRAGEDEHAEEEHQQERQDGGHAGSQLRSPEADAPGGEGGEQGEHPGPHKERAGLAAPDGGDDERGRHGAAGVLGNEGEGEIVGNEGGHQDQEGECGEYADAGERVAGAEREGRRARPKTQHRGYGRVDGGSEGESESDAAQVAEVKHRFGLRVVS